MDRGTYLLLFGVGYFRFAGQSVMISYLCGTLNAGLVYRQIQQGTFIETK